MERAKRIRRPSKFLTGLPRFFAWPVFKLMFNLHVDKKEIKNINGSFILICNHGAAIDPPLVYCALYPKLINFVGGYGYFKNKFLNWYFNKLGSIPKFQYQTDLHAMKDMLSVVKQGGILGIFPAGRIPSMGAGFEIPSSLTKLIKLSKVPVVYCRIDGNAMSRPKWAKDKHVRRGRVNMKFGLLFTQDQVLSLDQETMTSKINEVMMFNDYEFAIKNNISYGKKHLAEGIETTLYICPHCGKEEVMTSSNNTIMCRNCGYKFELNPNGSFDKNDYFNNPYEYYEWQRNSIRKLIEDESFKIISQCDANITNINSIEEHNGKGEVEINYNSIIYRGTIENEYKEVVFPLDELFSLPYRAGVNFEIADGNDIYKFTLPSITLPSKACLIVEELYKKKKSI